ncbi:MAG: nucleotidyl transferase AbiEii/AbiGii toxin family protein [Bacteroidia bacterium]|nr:nucleotidyl transferase AbiEii/AbiGii toxin family protein [Bacteroidia bacterium]
MISNKSLSLEWINEVSAKNNKADKILIEKVIRALLLLEGLAESEFSFVFKGGTALMLMFGSARRLSIDIDIIVPENIDFKSIFENMVKTKWFTRYSEQKRKIKSKIPKSHFKFFYKPVYRTSEAEDYVLLDILFDKTHYQKLVSISVDSAFVEQEGPPANVSVPCFDDILGDKLTAYAPNTTGIPYQKNGNSQAMEIIKQLYDIGYLFNRFEDLSVVAKTFNEYVNVESGYRGINVNPEDVVDDIFQTSLLLGTRGMEGKGDFTALLAGITQIRQFIFSELYHIDKAITHSAKASYLAIAIRKKIPSLEKYKEPGQIKNWIIEQPFHTRLNKLKKSNPEAFFYWYKIYELTK